MTRQPATPMNPVIIPHAGFVVIWAFWLVGVPLYIYGLATGASWATPAGALCWLVAFFCFETLAWRVRPTWTLSGVIGYYVGSLSAGGDRSWHWLVDVVAAPIMLLVLYTSVLLVDGWAGWVLGLGLAGPGLVLLHRHWRFMSRPLEAM